MWLQCKTMHRQFTVLKDVQRHIPKAYTFQFSKTIKVFLSSICEVILKSILISKCIQAIFLTVTRKTVCRYIGYAHMKYSTIIIHIIHFRQSYSANTCLKLEVVLWKNYCKSLQQSPHYKGMNSNERAL